MGSPEEVRQGGRIRGDSIVPAERAERQRSNTINVGAVATRLR